MPKPCGTRSNHRLNDDEFLFHKATSVAAPTVSKPDDIVRMYNFPVFRIILRVCQRSVLILSAYHTNQPAKRLPVDMAIYVE